MQDEVGLWAQLECRGRLGCWAGCVLHPVDAQVPAVGITGSWGKEGGVTPRDLHAQQHHIPPNLQPPLGVPGRWGAPQDQVKGAVTTWSCGPAQVRHSHGPSPSSSQPKSVLPSSLHPGPACVTQGLQRPSPSYLLHCWAFAGQFRLVEAAWGVQGSARRL